MTLRGWTEADRGVRLPAGRKADLAAYVSEVGEVTVTALAARFGVSPDTIRRDLDQLDTDGLLIRTHGGAISTTALPRPDTGIDVRLRLQIEAKDTIGALAAQLVQDGSSVMMNGGTTVLAVARSGSVQLVTQTTTGPIRFHSTSGGSEHPLRCDLAVIGVGGCRSTTATPPATWRTPR